MRNWATGLAAGILLASLAGCNTSPKSEFEGIVHPDVLAAAGLQYYWRVSVPMDSGERVARLYRMDENLYCLTNLNRLIGIDAVTGVPKWSYVVADPQETVFPPTHADGVQISEKVSGVSQIMAVSQPTLMPAFNAVMINTLSYVVVLDRTNGRLMRKISFDFAASVGGASDGACFFVGSNTGRYYGIRLQEALNRWPLSTSGTIIAPLEYYGGRLYVAGTEGVFSCTQITQTSQIPPPIVWKTPPASGAFTAPFHVDQRGCFVPCGNGRLYGLDAMTGRPLWDPFVCKGPLQTAVQVDDTTVFQYAEGDTFYAINLTSGKQRWVMPNGRVVLAAMEGDVYVLDDRRGMQVVDEVLGKTKTTIPMVGFNLLLPNTDAPSIFAATADGRVACIRLKSAGYLSPEMLGAKRPKAAEPASAPAPARH
jgi:outer membrane protein assembly factor BamB